VARNKYLHIIIGLLLAGAGLYIFFRGDDAVLETLASEMAGTSAVSVAVCAALAIFSMWLRAVRLGIMLPDEPPPADGKPAPAAGGRPPRSKRGLFAITTVSYMINNILPARLGEAARVFLMWKRNGFPVTVCIGALILERALDTLAYLSFIFIPIWLSPQIAASLRALNPAAPAVVWLAFAAFAAVAGMFALYALVPRLFRAAARRAAKLLPPKAGAAAGKIGEELESGLDWIFSPRKAVAVITLTWATAMCYAVMLPILIADWSAFGPLEAIFGQAFAAFGSAIPLAPGAVGTLHAVLLQGLAMMGVEVGKARAVVVLYHGLQYAVITLAGLMLLAGMGVKIKDITQKSEP